MQIVIFTIGTEGDVRPLVALGAGLKQRGHKVRLATHPMFRNLIERHGLEFAELDGDFRDWMSTDKKIMGRALRIGEMLTAFRQKLKEISKNWPEQGMVAARGADLIIGNGMVSQLGCALGERLGIACIETQLVPSFPSSNPPPVPLPPSMYGLPPSLNYGLGWLVRRSMAYVIQPAYDEHIRPQLGLAPFGRRSPYKTLNASHLRLVGVSPTLVPRYPGWPDTIQVVGQWGLTESENWQPPAHLDEFLQNGEKPVYIGFGSMYHAGAAELTDLFKKVLEHTGMRAVIVTGWGGLDGVVGTTTSQLAVIDRAPHDWLFQHVGMAVHHGGAGTTHAAARAGIPSVVMPVFGDQPFWASRLNRLGAAPPALPRKKASFERLLKAFSAAAGSKMQASARHLGRVIRSEDGVGTAIDLMERHGVVR
ncbi:glycosyltransferase [Rhizobium helianthi]|uniref:Glycosyltransferase n=1 Tax=Rhizobium helianthi TaxID=1132695 RepID=A0ABW4M0Z1_9HYPH